MDTNKQKIFLFFLFLFSVYCALTIGQSWDEGYHYLHGKTTLQYLLSFGRIDNDLYYREYYSSIYWSLKYFILKIFPFRYEFEVGQLINLFFSLATIFGIKKVCNELFNKKVGKIVFLILFFYPVFFGHMALNSKDTILAFSHVWIFYFVLRYLKKQKIRKKINEYIFSIGALAALATGIQLFFLSSLLPILFFILIDVFIYKKISIKKFSKKVFFIDIFKCFIVFYILLILFWIDAHPNILMLPVEIIINALSSTYTTGWPLNLVGGSHYLSQNVPSSYLIINIFYKSPEYFLISYFIFIILFSFANNFFIKKFKFIYYKLLLILFILIFPNLLLIIIPYPIYDGLRLFLWFVPYLCIIPGLTIYYFIENISYTKSKVSLIFLSFLIFYFLFNFFSYTPYQYAYLNYLNGQKDNRYKKFENDYWGSSLKELVKKSDFKNDKTILISTCGASVDVLKYYFKKKEFLNFNFVKPEDAEYMIMTNRSVFINSTTTKAEDATTCYEKYDGEDLFLVRRNGQSLSVLRKIK